VTGLHPDLLGELTALPKLPSWIKGKRKGDRGNAENGKIEKGNLAMEFRRAVTERKRG